MAWFRFRFPWAHWHTMTTTPTLIQGWQRFGGRREVVVVPCDLGGQGESWYSRGPRGVGSRYSRGFGGQLCCGNSMTPAPWFRRFRFRKNGSDGSGFQFWFGSWAIMLHEVKEYVASAGRNLPRQEYIDDEASSCLRGIEPLRNRNAS